jgi:hypothetical protein
MFTAKQRFLLAVPGQLAKCTHRALLSLNQCPENCQVSTVSVCSMLLAYMFLSFLGGRRLLFLAWIENSRRKTWGEKNLMFSIRVRHDWPPSYNPFLDWIHSRHNSFSFWWPRDMQTCIFSRAWFDPNGVGLFLGYLWSHPNASSTWWDDCACSPDSNYIRILMILMITDKKGFGLRYESKGKI